MVKDSASKTTATSNGKTGASPGDRNTMMSPLRTVPTIVEMKNPATKEARIAVRKCQILK
jgi:hypothetical protein